MRLKLDRFKDTIRTVIVGGGRAVVAPFRGRRVVSVLAGVVLGVALVHTTGVNPATAFTLGGELAAAIDAQAVTP